MSYRLDTHVLTVDANVIHKVDTGNPANLYSMWTVFSRCADLVEQGRRLENLSWRLWQRAQLIENQAQASRPSQQQQRLSQPIPHDRRPTDVPQLSGSVDSVIEDETVEFTSVSAPLEIARPQIWREDSTTSNRSKRERHISSDDFGKMVVSIVQDRAPLSAPTCPPIMPLMKKNMSPSPTLQRPGPTSTNSQPSLEDLNQLPEQSKPSSKFASRQPTVVRGFSPSSASIPRIVPTVIPPPTVIETIEPDAAPAAKVILPKKKPTFALGASCSSNEMAQSVEVQKPIDVGHLKKPMFQIGGSSEEEGSLKSAMQHSRSLVGSKKQASFSNHVSTIPHNNEAAVDSDSDCIDESAIDDEDDSSEWEDSIEDSGKSSMDDKFFQRVDSKANLTTRPSLITLMLAQSEQRAKNLSNLASQSTSAIPRSRLTQGNVALAASPNDSDEAPLMMKGTRSSNLKPISEAPRCGAQPIPAQPIRCNAQAALSPRTTRRNMLSTELTESLRRHLLWERQQKSSTANAVLKRRHTSQDVANLKQYPEKVHMQDNKDSDTWNQYFNRDTLDGYHSKGW